MTFLLPALHTLVYYRLLSSVAQIAPCLKYALDLSLRFIESTVISIAFEMQPRLCKLLLIEQIEPPAAPQPPQRVLFYAVNA